MTTAYLFHGNSVLLMKRASNRSFMPGVWCGVGGHVHGDEQGDLRASCLREIKEETGLCSANLDSFALQYIILRQSKDELRQQFVYFGTTTKTQVIDTHEGTLHWVPRDQILDLDMSKSNQLMMEHYLQGKQADHAWVGTIYGAQPQPRIHWVPMSDWE